MWKTINFKFPSLAKRSTHEFLVRLSRLFRWSFCARLGSTHRHFTLHRQRHVTPFAQRFDRKSSAKKRRTKITSIYLEMKVSKIKRDENADGSLVVYLNLIKLRPDPVAGENRRLKLSPPRRWGWVGRNLYHWFYNYSFSV